MTNTEGSDKDKLAKRVAMQRETWIKNVMRIYGWTRERAESEYIKIQP